MSDNPLEELQKPSDGYREAILYLFKKGEMVLIDTTPVREVVFPYTQVEPTDLKPIEDEDQEDYRVASLLKHLNTRFGEDLEVNNYEYLGEFEVSDAKVRFYGFLINDWEGHIDDLSEKGFEGLEWIDLSSDDKRLSLDSAKFFIGKVHEIERETNYIG